MQCVDHAANPVFEEVRDVTKGIAMREEVPAPGAVAVVVEPGAEDEVGGDAEEEGSEPARTGPNTAGGDGDGEVG